MNFDKWDFYLVSAKTLNEKFPDQKKIGLSSLMKLNPKVVGYESLAAGVGELAGQLRK